MNTSGPEGVAHSRRRFLTTSALIGTGLLGSRAIVEALGTTEFSTRGLVTEHPIRGTQIQINPPPPPPPPPPVKWHPGDFVRNVDVDTPRMAFSFDDGPSPSNTYHVLRALAARNVKATFFLVGVNVRAYPQIARDIVSEGHELGNHSIFHTPYRATSLANQIPGNNDIIQSTTGVRPIISRAPGLTRGSVILWVCAQQGMYEAHTSMSTSDYLSPRWSASRLISQFAGGLTPGAIPIYHDGGGARPTRDAVPSMIDIALGRGYQCMTITDLVNSGNPQPGRQTYGSLTSEPAPHDMSDGADCCRFDARQGLIDRLDETGVSAAERSRIVEQLALFDDHLADHDS